MVDVAGDDPRPERDRGDDRRLGAGVEALDIGGWVALREPEALRLGERLAVGRAVLGHAGEDEVGRAVDDADHAADGLAAQALPQAAHERDAARHRRLEQQVHAAAVGGLEQLDADVGEQLLVGRHDRLAAGQRRGDQLAGRLDAADHLDDEVDLGIDDDVVDVAGQHAWRKVDVSLPGEVAHGHSRDLEAHPGASFDLLGLLVDQTDERTADVAAAEHPDPHVSPLHRPKVRGRP